MEVSPNPIPILSYASPRDRVVLRRDATNKIMGAIAYMIVGPFIGLLLGLFAAGAISALGRKLHINDHISTVCSLAAVALCVLGILAWAIHDYRRRAFQEYVITPYSIESAVGRKRYIWSIDEVSGIRLKDGGRRVVLDLTSGRYVHFDMELAPAAAVLRALHTGMLSEIAHRHEMTIESGQTLISKDLGLGAVPLAARIAVRIVMAVLAIFTIRFALIGARHLSDSLINLRQCAFAFSGGIRISREGVAALHHAKSIAWDEISHVKISATGCHIYSSEGRRISLSPYARHYCDVCQMLSRRGLVK
jgi:hypothetical protein